MSPPEPQACSRCPRAGHPARSEFQVHGLSSSEEVDTHDVPVHKGECHAAMKGGGANIRHNVHGP